MATELNQETAIAKVSQESISLYDRVIALVVTDQASHDLGVELYKTCIAGEKMADEAHDPVVSHWFAKHRAAVADKKRDKDKFTEGKKISKGKVDVWEQAEEAKRRAEELRLQEIARKENEEAIKKAREAAEAENKRIRDQEEAERLRLAQEAEELGATTEEVTEILNEPLYEPPPIVIEKKAFIAPTVARTYEKSAGFSGRDTYAANFDSLKVMVKAAAANDHFLQYIQFNEQAVNALARATKDAFSLPGCSLKKGRA